MRPSPTISVAMPAYQAERWIGETLESVLAQTSPPDEVVVVDDGSTDTTADIARGFGKAVRVVRQPNRGAPAAYNRAFAEASSDYIAMCPADDVWETTKLEWQREALAATPRIDIAFAGARFFGLEERPYPGPAQAGVQPQTFFREMYQSCAIPAPTAVIRRSLFEGLGGFREDLDGEDYEFWLRALRHRATFYYDPRPLVRLRQHGGNLSAQALSMRQMNLTLHREFAADLDDRRLADRTIARDLREIGRAQLGIGDVEGARRSYRESLTHAWSFGAATAASAMAFPGMTGLLRRAAQWRRARG